MNARPPLILASTSPYRRELLQRLGLPFECLPPGVDEATLPGEAPSDTARRLSLLKAQAVAAQHPEALVIGSDQVAELDGEPLGKPGSIPAAIQQLQRQSGRVVVFHTGLAVVGAARGFKRVEVAISTVQFRSLSLDEITRYVNTEQVLDCAGSAKAEGLGISLLERLESSDPTALIGLPLIRTCALLGEAGLHVLKGRA